MSIPAKPTLTTPPDVPQRTDPPTTFADRADAYVTWQAGFRGELAAAIDWQDVVFTETETVYNDAVSETTAQKDQAVTARQGAETAQGAAETARDKSQEWAEAPEDTEVETGQYSALHHAAKAEGYKDTAETAAAAAQSSAGLPSLTGQAGNSLKVNGAEDGVEWGSGLIAEYQEFTASGTWNKDPNATWVYVEAIGGGGGGSGEGGGGGAYAPKLFRAADIGSSETITVGSGGVGGDHDNGPSDGGASAFGTHLSAPGGGQGTNDKGGNGGGGELGAQSQTIPPVGGFSSGGGGSRYGDDGADDGADCVMGGAGGGGDPFGDGGVSANGGNGGDAESPGEFPGGGGGSNAAGADGVVRIWQW